jgi:hypothetical protein
VVNQLKCTPVLSDKFHDNTITLSTKEPVLRLRKHGLVGDFTGLVNTKYNTVQTLMDGENRKAIPRVDIKKVGINSMMMMMMIIIIIIIIRRVWRSEKM